MYKFLKRFFDFLVALIGLILLSPLFLIVSVCIKLDSPGKVFFCQERIGYHARPFNIYKFRTMVSDAAKIGPLYTSDSDSRITKVGKFLRKTSLDELPQLLNVLKGEMSLVGFRPGVLENYTEEELKSDLFSVKPGITGNAQVNGRSDLEYDEKRYYEMEYVKNCSLGMDIKILIKTVQAVLGSKGTN